jgi:hypothetical protein
MVGSESLLSGVSGMFLVLLGLLLLKEVFRLSLVSLSSFGVVLDLLSTSIVSK